MTGFAVNPADLQAFANLLGGPAGQAGNQQEAAGEASRYLTRNATLPQDTTDSLFGRVGLKHKEIMSLVSQGFSNTGRAAGGSAQALIEVAQYYESTDAANAALVDATIPHTQPIEGPTPSHISLTGLPDAAAKLVTPQVPADFPDPSEPIREVLNWLTGSGEIEQLVTEMLGWNPYQRAGEFFGGDWHAFARAGDAFGAAGECEWTIADNISSANDAVAQTWQGNAADAAQSYFGVLSGDIDGFGAAVNSLRQGYQELATSAYLASVGMQDLLHTLTDDVMTAVLALGAGLTPELANLLVHLFPEFVKTYMINISMAIAAAEILTSLALNIQATNDIRDETSYVRGEQPGGAPYQPPKQLVH